MPELVNVTRDQFGLGGGTILSGSVTLKCDAFWYYPVIASSATVKFNNLNGTSFAATFSAGMGVYGGITEVTQSSGISVVYSGSYMYPNQR